ncbi:MAG: hypothetical protein UU14_C0003G0080 [Candidatus Roizmanbacteria bacterium GW2011_GWB1_40_7]|uniref:Uncharacterized protein n=2 Tax=Candidatus Roizmaniibacteriota TaxID=1752723 RepID=A0A0G0WBZ3_9BACT|nr:MAG: hypothetical protein UU14_C0003G0080 [Candidatus Roizmanbacteria bacterium GW2011_GWB1_40_7]
MFRKIYLPILIFATVSVGIIAFTIFRSNRLPLAPLSNEFCDLVKIEETKTQFCIDKRLIKDYEIRQIDRRSEKINRANEVVVYIKTRDYKESGELVPGSSSWRDFKIVSGIYITFTVNLNTRFQNFEELAKVYSTPFYEPHNEFPPRKGGKVNQINDLKYISELEVNDRDNYSKGIAADTHFLNNGKEYNLSMSASFSSINKDNFLLLHNNILKTIRFDSESLDLSKLSPMTCDELSMLLDEEYSQLDFSCRSDNECVESDIRQCNCKAINTNTQKAGEIDKILQEKKCLRVQIQCRPFECKCRDKVCTKVKIGW